MIDPKRDLPCHRMIAIVLITIVMIALYPMMALQIVPTRMVRYL